MQAVDAFEESGVTEEKKLMTQGDAIVAAAEIGEDAILCRSSPRMLGEIGVIVGKVPNAGETTLHNIHYTAEQVIRMAARYHPEDDEPQE